MILLQILLVSYFQLVAHAAPETPTVDIFVKEGRQLSFTVPQSSIVPFETLPTGSDNVKNDIVNIHNQLRKQILATNMLEMNWNNEAAGIAQRLSDSCVYMHDSNDQRKTSNIPCGQNIAKSTLPISWMQIIAMWWGEIKDFRFGQQPLGIVGHFTQCAWAISHQLGCSVSKCNGFFFYVCNYCPAGNILGKENNPYIPGQNCAACPGNCRNNLCTNACQFSNVYSNCDDLDNQMHFCQSNLWPDYKSKCQATCNCKGKAIY